MYAVYDRLFLDEEGAAEYMLEAGEVCLRRVTLRNGRVTFSIDLAGYDWSATLYWRMERELGAGYLDSIGVRFPFGDGSVTVPVSVRLPEGAPRIRLDGSHNVLRADVVYYLWTSCNGLDRLYLFGDAQSACDVSVRMWLALDDDTKTAYTREGRFVLTYADGLLPQGNIGMKIFDFTEANEDDWNLEQDILYGEGGGIVRALRRIAHDHEVRGEGQEDGGCDVLRDGAPPGGTRRGGVQVARRLRDPHAQDQAELGGHARPR